MRSCCVTACKSNSARDDCKTISFHEFPCNLEFRTKWLRAVKREKSWVPNSSLHFHSKDFRNGPRRRLLHPDTIPSLHLPDKSPEVILSSDDSSMDLLSDDDDSRMEAALYDDDDDLLFTVQSPVLDKDRPADEAISQPAPSEALLLDSNNHIESLNVSLSELVQDQNELSVIREVEISDSSLIQATVPIVEDIPYYVIEVPSSASSDKCKMMNKVLKKKLRKLRSQLQVLKEEARSRADCDTEGERLTEDTWLKVVDITTDAKMGDERAAFLLDAIRAYGNKNHKWSPSSVKHCILWRLQSMKSYAYFRSNMTRVPPWSVLRQHVVEMPPMDTPAKDGDKDFLPCVATATGNNMNDS